MGRRFGHDRVARSSEDILAQFRAFAAHSGGRLTVELKSYVQGRVVGAIPRPVKITNVIATLHGTQRASARRTYVVSGHYDSRGTDVENPDCNCPGADNDASGVSAVLDLARVMSTHRFDATIKFMAVDGEEQGLFGSTHFVKVARQQHLDVAGMLDNDIISTANGADPHSVRLFFEGVESDASRDYLTLLQLIGGENDSPARELSRFAKSVGENGATGMNVDLIFRRDRVLRGGDQIPFLANGYHSAVRFTEQRENFDHQHQDVRTVNGVVFGDLLRFVDFAYLARVTRVNLATLASLADAPAQPADARIVAVKLTNTTTLTWSRNSEPDLAGYEIVWRDTTAPLWQHSRRVGTVTRFTLDLPKDNFFFGIRSVDSSGNRSPAVFPLPKF